MVERFIEWLLNGLLDLGYPGIVVLMAMESSILPVPSELVMPPAGYWVAKGEMNFVAAVACGVVGSILGALANYFAAHLLAGPFLRRFGRYLVVTESALRRSERFFAQHGEISTFSARMLPVVRHLISIPAGLHRMPLPRFITYTGLGALVWCSILTWIGYFLGQNEGVLRSEEVQRYVSRALWILIPALAALVLVYTVRHRRRTAHSSGQG